MIAENISIRAAYPDDAERLGVVHVLSWQSSYAGHFPQQFLDSLNPSQRADTWRLMLSNENQERQTNLVVESDGILSGFASVGPSRDDDANGAGEVYGLYLLPELWGHGIGRKLMAAALEALVGYGFDHATLWVLDANERARRFYEAGNWAADGATKVDERHGFPIAEIRYRNARINLPND
jgi:ribosomal protein S18 acetylase RimI-like enzyme